jgi:hypothetical protein
VRPFFEGGAVLGIELKAYTVSHSISSFCVRYF